MDRPDVVLTEAEVLEALQGIASSRFAITRELRLTDELVGDLDLDSVELITFAISIEEHFKVALPMDASNRMETVGDLCRLIAGGRSALT